MCKEARVCASAPALAPLVMLIVAGPPVSCSFVWLQQGLREEEAAGALIPKRSGLMLGLREEDAVGVSLEEWAQQGGLSLFHVTEPVVCQEFLWHPRPKEIFNTLF